LWELGDGHKRYGQKFKYCYRKPGLYNAVLNVSVKNDQGVVEKNKFDVEIDLRNREALRMERYYYDKWLYLIADPYNCNGCKDQVFHWKWGTNYSCGEELRIHLDDPEPKVYSVMEYSKNGKPLKKACYINISKSSK